MLVRCVTSTSNYFRVFRRHAALLVVAIEELCLLPGPQTSLRAFERTRGMPRKPSALTLAPCLTTKSIGNIVQGTYDTTHRAAMIEPFDEIAPNFALFYRMIPSFNGASHQGARQ
jgi:hypothetical protein